VKHEDQHPHPTSPHPPSPHPPSPHRPAPFVHTVFVAQVGNWTAPLGILLQYTCRLLAARFGREQAPTATTYEAPLPPGILARVYESLLPLVYQILYSKNAGVSRCGDLAMKALLCIAPRSALTPTMAFVEEALVAINQTHQAPAAIRSTAVMMQVSLDRRSFLALLSHCSPSPPLFTHVWQPFLYSPSTAAPFLSALPEILRLSLAGIDGNDDKKTVSTLRSFQQILRWLPIGTAHSPSSTLTALYADPSTSAEWSAAASLFPPTSPLYTPYPHETDTSSLPYILEDTLDFMADWAMLFLERVFTIFKSQDKVGKANSYSASVRAQQDGASQQQLTSTLQVRKLGALSQRYPRLHTCVWALFVHTAPFVHIAAPFIHIAAPFVHTCVQSMFYAMDDASYKRAVSALSDFLSSADIPDASKSISDMCWTCVRANPAFSLPLLFPILSSLLSSQSKQIQAHRVRVLGGMIRAGGPAVLEFKSQIISIISLCLASDDKAVRKSGCKLLKQALSTNIEITITLSPKLGASPNISSINQSTQSTKLGASPNISSFMSGIQWQTPTAPGLEFCVELLQTFLSPSLTILREVLADNSSHSIEEWRKAAKVLLYCVRGAVGILLDEYDDSTPLTPFEQSLVSQLKAREELEAD